MFHWSIRNKNVPAPACLGFRTSNIRTPHWCLIKIHICQFLLHEIFWALFYCQKLFLLYLIDCRECYEGQTTTLILGGHINRVLLMIVKWLGRHWSHHNFLLIILIWCVIAFNLRNYLLLNTLKLLLPAYVSLIQSVCHILALAITNTLHHSLLIIIIWRKQVIL